jgi:hypothetical protein
MRRFMLRSVVALGALMPSIAGAQEKCKPATEATNLPAVSALLDSASLVRNLPAPDLAAAKEVVVRVTTRPAPRAVVMDSVASRTESGRVLVDRILASLKPNAKNLLPAFRLRVLLGEAPALSVLPAVVCPPGVK